MTGIYCLRAVDETDAIWAEGEGRPIRCDVYASTEAQARELAALEYGGLEQSPWLDPGKVECRVAEPVGEKPPEGYAAVIKRWWRPGPSAS